MRVGDRTDFNKLVFEIETDGSVKPEAAFKKAVDILDEHIKILASIEITPEAEPAAPKKVAKKSKKSE